MVRGGSFARGGQRQRDRLTDGEPAGRRPVRREPHIDPLARDPPRAARGAQLDGRPPGPRARQRRAGQRPAVGGELEVDVVGLHRAQRPRAVADAGDARTPPHLERLDTGAVVGEVRRREGARERAGAGDQREIALVAHVAVRAGEVRGAGGDPDRRVVRRVRRHGHGRPVQHRDRVPALVVRHAHRRAGHAALGERRRARRPEHPLALAVGRRLGLRDEAVAGLEFHGAFHLDAVLARAHFSLARPHPEGAPPAVRHRHARAVEPLAPVRIREQPVVLEPEVLRVAEEVEQFPAGALRGGRRVLARHAPRAGRRAATPRGPEREIEHHQEGRAEDGDHEAEPPLPPHRGSMPDARTSASVTSSEVKPLNVFRSIE